MIKDDFMEIKHNISWYNHIVKEEKCGVCWLERIVDNRCKACYFHGKGLNTYDCWFTLNGVGVLK